MTKVYLDDIIFGSPLESLAYVFAECLKQEFEMSMVGELSYFLGLQVRQTEDGLFISQSKYTKDLVKRFGLDSKKHTRTPMSTSLKLSRDASDPKESHLSSVRRIIRYVSGTVDLGIFYSRNSNLDLAGYSDADWAGNADDRKSKTVGCFYMGSNLVAWLSKKQNYISLSMAEAEYIAAVSLDHVSTDNQLADLLTKPLNGLRFESLRMAVGVCSPI
ncbi:uncharacterized protein LOC111400129 [Olea europaea var. sylvestris]|uniref:uncharacterized protein LOC111400129 n=1 Tax=Olea europaea var. sylvestris TaxID=158386 RepID=UPI000C1D563D|nr:uncharacterized protein LOC111400129 [Olea europaea var. sylvestris]